MTAAAVGLGAAGGGLDTFNRRVFGVQARGGSVLTQLSGGAARKANAVLHPEAAKKNEADVSQESRNASASPLARDDYNSYIPTEENYSANPNAHNAYEEGHASMVGADEGVHYQIGKEDLGDAGVRISAEKKSDSAKVSYDFSKMSQGDINRAHEMAAIYQHGSEEEKATLEAAGIESIQLRTKMVNGQETVTGIDMTANADSLNKNFGIDVKPASMGGKGMEVSAPSRETAPQLVPDVTQYLNTTANRSFLSADVQQVGGSVTVNDSGMSTVTIPTASVPQLAQKYQSLDTSTATVSGDNTVFSVPSSSLIQESAPQSPVVQKINQRRIQAAAPPPPVEQATQPVDQAPPVRQRVPPVDQRMGEPVHQGPGLGRELPERP